MFELKSSPPLPNSFGTQYSAELVLTHEGKTYLLPGVTYKKRGEVAYMPVQKTGEKPKDKSFGAEIAKINPRYLPWYSLTLEQKQLALEVLLQHFQGKHEDVARVLGHHLDYVTQLAHIHSLADENELTVRTKIEHHLASGVGAMVDPMVFFKKDPEAGAKFLEELRPAFLASKLTSNDPFVVEAKRTMNKVALRFLLSLNKSALFIPAEVISIITAHEAVNDFDLLPDLCAALELGAERIQSLSLLLFPNEGIVKKLSVAQINWRLQLLKRVLPRDEILPWNPAYKSLSVHDLLRLVPDLWVDYVLENIRNLDIAAKYSKAPVAEKTARNVLRLDSSLPEARAHRIALQNWSQAITGELTYHEGELTTETTTLMVVRTAIRLLKDNFYWPNFLEGRLDESTSPAVAEYLMTLFDERKAHTNALQDGTVMMSVLGRIYSWLKDTDKQQVMLYGRVKEFGELFQAPGRYLTRTDICELNQFLLVLLTLVTAEEKVELEALPICKVLRTMAVADSKGDAELSEFEIKLLKGLLKTPDLYLEKLKGNRFSYKLFQNFVSGLQSQPLLSPKDVVQQNILLPKKIKIPSREEVRERNAWLEATLRDCEVDAEQTRNENAIVTVRGLRYMLSKREDIKTFFETNLHRLQRGDDVIYAKEGVLIHFGNAYIFKDGKHGPDWEHMSYILDDILIRMLTIYATAKAWKDIDRNHEKLNSFFNSMQGYCIESRTRTLLDNTPAWATQNATVDDMESLTEKIKGLVTQHSAYLFKGQQGFPSLTAKAMLWNWFQGEKYQYAGEILPIEYEHIEGIVDALMVPETEAESLLAISKVKKPILAPGAQAARDRYGAFGAQLPPPQVNPAPPHGRNLYDPW